MKRYLVRRVLQMVPSLFAIVVASFALIHAIPGDPVQTLGGEDVDAVTRARIEAEYGLDQPLPAQFGRYLGRLVRGDLGDSYSYGAPVRDVIARALPSTVLLTGTALVMSTAVGVWLGVVAARRPSGVMDHVIGAATLTAFAIPGFWLAQLAIQFPALRWGWFPVEGYSTVTAQSPTGLRHLADVAYHLMLPAMVLATAEVGAVTRLVRSGLLSQYGMAYTRVAQGKGLRPEQVLSRHALRNALLPVVTLIGARVGFLFSGAVVIEALFSWPGLGSILRAAATTTKDPPLLLGIVIVTSAAIMVANLVTDVVYTWVDPRVRLD